MKAPQWPPRHGRDGGMMDATSRGAIGAPSSPGHAVSVAGVSKSYETKRAVIDFSVNVPRGSLFGLIGPNGAGKTTTLRLMLNIYAPDTGTIHVLGRPMTEQTKGRIGYLPEER